MENIFLYFYILSLKKNLPFNPVPAALEIKKINFRNTGALRIVDISEKNFRTIFESKCPLIMRQKPQYLVEFHTLIFMIKSQHTIQGTPHN